VAAAYVAKDGRLPARSVRSFGQPSSIRPGLTRILALEDCPEIDQDRNSVREGGGG
jgi:hypothetical protein